MPGEYFWQKNYSVMSSKESKVLKKKFILYEISELLILFMIKALKDTNQNINSCCFRLVVL